MLDLLKATNILYGDCSKNPPSTDIYIGDTLATPEQMVLIEAKAAELETAYDALSYSRNRKTAYDALNQFELMTDDAANSTTTHADAIAAIKAEFPKP